MIDTTPEDNHGLRFHSADMALKGVGQTTGTRYRSVFTITEVRQGSDEDGPFTETLSVHSRLIAPGPANDLVFSIVFHLTINAKGETVIIFNRLVDEACV